MRSNFNRKAVRIFTFLLSLALLLSCAAKKESGAELLPLVAQKALADSNSVYYANFNEYPYARTTLPIGMFDSGTGGLTVLEQFLALDLFNNQTNQEGSDGIPDFAAESFIYLADQANMPYGLYPSLNREAYLKELIIKDALFLTTEPHRTKIVVIACNTATAYGLQDVSKMLELSGTKIKTIGVISAGVEGAMSFIEKSEPKFAVGILATLGTVASGGYQNGVFEYGRANNYSGDIRVVAQGGAGFAEAVDSEPDFIDYKATKVRENYRGPAWNAKDGIVPSLLPLYNFDLSGNALLVERDANGEITSMQLNSTGNYARFHLVTLLHNHLEQNPGVELKSVILGCTHYPYLIDTLKRVVEELRVYKAEEKEPFKEVISPNLVFIDPALNAAKECYLALREAALFNKEGQNSTLKGFISVPADNLPEGASDQAGNLAFDFKYGREVGQELSYVKVVPFSLENINKDNLNRIRERLPLSYSLIEKNLYNNDI